MTRTIVLLSFLVPLLSFQVCAQRGPFVSSEGGFSIDLPTEPGEFKDALEAKAGGRKLGWRNKGALFTVGYADKASATSDDAEHSVSLSADAYIGALPKAAEVIARNKLKLDDHPGVEIRTREKDGFSVIARYYMVNKRMFCIMAMWDAGPNDDYVLKTIDSFRVIKSDPLK